jgi:hypothetical protein
MFLPQCSVWKMVYTTHSSWTPGRQQVCQRHHLQPESAFVIYTMESYGILIPQDEPELKAAIDAALPT